MRFLTLCLLALVFASCSPLRTSPNDEKHQLELTLHEVQTNLDDLRHGTNCFQTELQILEGRIKHFESALASLKQNELQKQQTKIDQIAKELQQFEKKWGGFEKKHTENSVELESLSAHAQEMTVALAQFKERISEIEEDLLAQNRAFDEFSKHKVKVDGDYKLYKVKAGDSLEKIARLHKTSVEKIKKLNELGQDLIVAGQQLKIPKE